MIHARPALIVALAAAGFLIGSAPEALGASLTWTASGGGNLMDPANWGDGTVTPQAGDSLSITSAFEDNLTFPAETPASGTFSALTFEYGARAFTPGKDHTLHVENLNIRRSERFTFSSGSYAIGKTFAIGLSTSSTDNTKVSVTGEDTYVKAVSMQIGTGSSAVAQSRGAVTIADGAVVDAKFEIGRNGGWKNSLLVTGADSKLYATNGISTIGSAKMPKTDGSKIYYSWTNSLTVANGAHFEASTLRVGADDLQTWGNSFSVTNLATASVSNLYVYGTNKVFVSDGGELDIQNVRYFTAGGEIAVSNGVANVKGLLVGWDNNADSVGNVFKVEDGAKVTVDTCYIFGTNSIIVSGGELIVTNAIYVGRTEISAGGIGGCLLDVCGGRVTTKGTLTLYAGTGNRRVDAATIRVSNGGEIVMTNAANYVQVGPQGAGHRLTVTGAGSKFLHYPYNTARSVFVGAVNGNNPSVSYGNTLTVSDGGYFKTSASIIMGNFSTNETFAVAGGSVDIAQNLEVGNGSFSSNAVFSVSGSQSRVRIAKSVMVGGHARVVFDLSDAQGSDEALVQLGTAPTFAPGSEIYVTSSNPAVNGATPFVCTLVSSAVDMDLSNVSVTFDPAINIRRLDSGNPRVLKVRCGRTFGFSVTVR